MGAGEGARGRCGGGAAAWWGQQRRHGAVPRPASPSARSHTRTHRPDDHVALAHHCGVDGHKGGGPAAGPAACGSGQVGRGSAVGGGGVWGSRGARGGRRPLGSSEHTRPTLATGGNKSLELAAGLAGGLDGSRGGGGSSGGSVAAAAVGGTRRLGERMKHSHMMRSTDAWRREQVLCRSSCHGHGADHEPAPAGVARPPTRCQSPGSTARSPIPRRRRPSAPPRRRRVPPLRRGRLRAAAGLCWPAPWLWTTRREREGMARRDCLAIMHHAGRQRGGAQLPQISGSSDLRASSRLGRQK